MGQPRYSGAWQIYQRGDLGFDYSERSPINSQANSYFYKLTRLEPIFESEGTVEMAPIIWIFFRCLFQTSNEMFVDLGISGRYRGLILPAELSIFEIFCEYFRALVGIRAQSSQALARRIAHQG
jgi:hypothetical protein